MRYTALLLLIVGFVLLAACTEAPHSNYLVDNSGQLTLRCPGSTFSEETVSSEPNYSVQRVIFHTENGPVYALLTAPAFPKAAFLHVPGAGVKKEGHAIRAARYADAGFAYLVIDPRGNGGETPGYPLNLDLDFARFQKGESPQYYLIICDLIKARAFLSGKFGVPVYAVGESNGGRYALIATALDPEMAGFIGISTSGFGLEGNTYQGDARKFLLSVDPARYAQTISPRPFVLFHARNDTVIPYAKGRELFDSAQDPKEFIDFNGTHGINEEVDDWILSEWAQIYPTRS
ncbi:MAG: alpha/beta hydrolase [Methanoregulaceae archaeon]|nr:alpha/beta hydrolase [Methanoregulaceae archaeon]